MKGFLVFFLLSTLFRLQNVHCEVTSSNSRNTSGKESEQSANELMTTNILQENSWECSKDSRIKENQLITLLDMIKEGDAAVSGVEEKIKNAVLVLGNPGVGKTTFVQFMAGNNSALISKEVGDQTGEYIIVDGKKISLSPIDSQTLYPEHLQHSDGSVLCDTPGFSDTRSPLHEVVATYVMKKYVKKMENVKIVLLANYNQLQYGISKTDFMDLLRSLNNFVRNILLYKDNIVLIATKVPNIIRQTKDGFVFVEDKNIMNSIRKFLVSVGLSLEDKLKQQEESKEKIFLKNAIEVILSLQEVDKNGNYKRINIFRRPIVPGPLQNITDLQKGKQLIQKTVYESTGYSKVREADFGYTLSDKAKNYLDCLLMHIDKSVMDICQTFFKNIKDHYKTKIEDYSSLYTLTKELEIAVKELENLKSSLEVSKGYNEYMNIITQFNNKHNIVTNKTENNIVLQILKYINELKRFIDTGSLLVPATWTLTMKPLIDYMKEELDWYKFLIQLYEWLSTYSIQNNKNEYLELFNFNETENEVSVKNGLIKVFSAGPRTIKENIKHYVTDLVLDERKMNDLKHIVSFCLNYFVNVSCSDNGILIIRGNYVRLSEIIANQSKVDSCVYGSLRSLNIFAVRTVFIDDDVLGNDYKGKNMMIVAPIWEVIGGRSIVLDGIEGKLHKTLKAEDGEEFGDNGGNGSPGLPGGNGGHFVGLGIEVLNGVGLKVQVNGGDGGQGQHGGDGRVGENGKNGSALLKVNLHERQNYNGEYSNDYRVGYEYLSGAIDKKGHMYAFDITDACYSRLKTLTRDGLEGKPGGNGGDGGVGGFGGNEGSVNIITVKENTGINIEAKHGNRGKPGTGGKGGKAGLAGESISCYKMILVFKQYGPIEKHFWTCNRMYRPVDPNCSTFSPSGKTGSFESEIIESSARKRYNYSKILTEYIVLLEERKNNTLVSQLLTEFLDKVLKGNIKSKK